jgi:hypothetical protein
VTLLDDLIRNCDSVFLQRVDAGASVSIFTTPIFVTNGVTASVPAPGTTGLTFKVNSDDLGLGTLIVPGFDLLFTGTGVPGTGGAEDRVIWTAGFHPHNRPGTLNFKLPNANSLAFDIESVSGSVTTTLAPGSVPAVPEMAGGRRARGAIQLLAGPAAGDQLAIETSYGTVTVAVNTLQLVALEHVREPAVREPAEAAGSAVPAPTFTVKMKPDSRVGGEFRIAGMTVPFNMKLVGADELWTCNVQLQGTPGLVSVTLTVTSDDETHPSNARVVPGA